MHLGNEEGRRWAVTTLRLLCAEEHRIEMRLLVTQCGLHVWWDGRCKLLLLLLHGLLQRARSEGSWDEFRSIDGKLTAGFHLLLLLLLSILLLQVVLLLLLLLRVSKVLLLLLLSI